MAGIDGAVTAFFIAQPLRCAWTNRDTDVGSDDRRLASHLAGSIFHPSASLSRPNGQHPVEEDTVGYRATDAAEAGSHSGHYDARLVGQEVAQGCNGPPDDLDRRGQLAGPDPDPELPRIEPVPVDLRSDPGRIVSVERKDPDTELELRAGVGEQRERFQARC
jgi:hypothetical protein